jgi:hypothetical protein
MMLMPTEMPTPACSPNTKAPAIVYWLTVSVASTLTPPPVTVAPASMPACVVVVSFVTTTLALSPKSDALLPV